MNRGAQLIQEQLKSYGDNQPGSRSDGDSEGEAEYQEAA